MARIYVASSWRNTLQPAIVEALRSDGHSVYDFRNPDHGLGGFSWSQIDPHWQDWSPAAYRDHLLKSPIAAHGFMTDQRALAWCDTCVKHTAILLESGEPELMYLLADHIATTPGDLRTYLRTNESRA